MTKKFYYMNDVAKKIGVSTRTLHRWIKDEKISEADRDRNNHRIFDEKMLKQIKEYANKITPAPHKLQGVLFPEKEGIK